MKLISLANNGEVIIKTDDISEFEDALTFILELTDRKFFVIRDDLEMDIYAQMFPAETKLDFHVFNPEKRVYNGEAFEIVHEDHNKIAVNADSIELLLKCVNWLETQCEFATLSIDFKCARITTR